MKFLQNSRATLLKTLIPGLASLIILALDNLMLQLKGSETDGGPHFLSNIFLNDSLEPIIRALKGLSEAIIGSYSNYFSFMLMMLFFNGLMYIFRGYFFSERRKENQEDLLLSWQGKLPHSERTKQIIKTIVTYSLLYCIYQVIWACAFGLLPISASSLQSEVERSATPLKIHHSLERIMMSNRILEGQSSLLKMENQLAKYDIRKPSLSIGKVLSEIDINAFSMKLSKDGKTAFVSANFPAALKIIDISDPGYPIVLSSLPLSKGTYALMFKSLIVSPDETKVFISNFEFLEIIDIADLTSPFFIAQYQDKSIVKMAPQGYKFGNELCKPNLLLSNDNKYLFVSGYGLQIFDISVLSAPALLSSTKSQLDKAGNLIPSSIAFSTKDHKTLYYSDGGIIIYNIEDPENIKVRNSFSAKNPISSMIISEEGTAFVLGLDEESKVFLQKLDISDKNLIKEGQMTRFDQVSSVMPIFLDQAPKDLFLLILAQDPETRSWHKLFVFDTQEQKLLAHEKMFVNEAFSVLFTGDYEKVLVGSNDKLKIVDLYLNFPNKNAFTESSNIIQTFDGIAKSFAFNFASNKKGIVYSLAFGASNWERVFGIQKLLPGSDQLAKASAHKIEGDVTQMVISQDNNLAFLLSHDTVFIVDISDIENLNILKKYTEEKKNRDNIRDFTLSRDGKTGYMTHTYFGKDYLKVIDFSDPKNPNKRGSISLNQEDGNLRVALSKDEQFVFVMARNLSIYNVSNPSSPALLTTLSFLVDAHFMVGRAEMIISPDGRTLFIKDGSALHYCTVHIIDISNPASPQIRSELHFPMTANSDYYSGRFFALSEDSRTFYVMRDSSLMAVDVSNSSTPRYLGAIQVLKDSSSDDYITDFCLSSDSQKAYFLTYEAKIHAVSLDPMYTTYLIEDVLLLGERYSMDLIALEMNKDMNYNVLGTDYRFTKFALVESRSIQNANFEGVSLKMPPSWMTLDLKSQILTIEARRKNDIGRYKMYFAFSTKLPEDIFIQNKVVNDTMESEDLFASLLSLGFINNEFYLTEYFGKYKEFILPSQYASVKQQVYSILKKYHFETFNELQIVQSLNMTWTSGKFQISTASLANLRVEFNLEGKAHSEAKFLSREYGSLIPTITNNKSRFDIEGSLKDINLALQEVVINLPGNQVSCDGEIIIDDKLNPIMTKSIKNISKYFNHNQPPGRNNNSAFTIQNQIDKELVYTGQYFQIKLSSHAFFDKYTDVENLKYQLVFVNDHNETAVLPTWLSFRDMTLMGTPPEEIFHRDYEFRLIVKNEFQEFKEPFKLNVIISSSFILKLLMKYSPYILTVLGLYIKANMIYNILAKRRYKNSKDFCLQIREEITPEVIFPVSFIEEERQEAKNILRLMRKKVAKEYRVRSVDINQFLSYFMNDDDGRLEKSKVFETIERILKEEGLSQKDRRNFDLYLRPTEGGLDPKRLINQIIINTLISEMLKSDDRTRKCFEEIREHWSTLVEWDLKNSCFKINDEKFKSRMFQTEGLNDDMENGLLGKASINFDLLKDAILGYAFDCQNVNSLPVMMKFNVKERVKANSLKRFLKLDLQDCSFREKGKIGYGIEYFKEYHTLYFDGVVQRDLRDKTVVVQIVNYQQRILKELWISGKSEGGLNDSSEVEAKGKDYEIF